MEEAKLAAAAARDDVAKGRLQERVEAIAGREVQSCARRFFNPVFSLAFLGVVGLPKDGCGPVFFVRAARRPVVTRLVLALRRFVVETSVLQLIPFGVGSTTSPALRIG